MLLEEAAISMDYSSAGVYYGLDLLCEFAVFAIWTETCHVRSAWDPSDVFPRAFGAYLRQQSKRSLDTNELTKSAEPSIIVWTLYPPVPRVKVQALST
jgi:hypothetical protein